MNRTAIVTGGGSGIGRAICELFAKEGWIVYCVDRNLSDATETSAQCEKDTYGLVVPLVGDVSRAVCVRDMISRCGTGYIDVLVNNAGIQPIASYMPLDEVKEDVWDEIFAVNVKGYYLMIKYCLPRFIRGSSIINIASVTAFAGAKNTAVYGASKAAIVGLTKHVALDYAESGIRVNAVCPGTIDTPLVRRTLEAQTGGKNSVNALNALKRAHPLGRIGIPAEVAKTVLFLASEAASFITGSVLTVDGGLSAKGAWAIEK